MHTATKQPSETDTATTQTPEEALAQVKAIYRIKRLESEVTMVAAQTKALETLIACMAPIENTGDTKLDSFHARERNRQRLAAIQTLLHIRTVQREKRLRRAMRAKAKAKAERTAKGGVVRSDADGHVDSSAPDNPDHGLRPIEDRTQTMPPPQMSPSRTRSRYKSRKPKHPKHPRKQKR